MRVAARLFVIAAIVTPVVVAAVLHVGWVPEALVWRAVFGAGAGILLATVVAAIAFPDPLAVRMRTLATRIPGADFRARRPPRHPRHEIHLLWGRTWMCLTVRSLWFGGAELRLEGTPVPRPPFAIRVSPRRPGVPIFGMREVEPGVAAFPPECAAPLLEAAGRDAIRRQGDIRIELTPVRALFVRRTRSRRLATAEAFVEFARRTLAAWLDGSAYVRGMRILDAEPASDRCPICCDPVTSAAVVCRTCETVHHRECWEYNGLCARFGCGQGRFIRKKTT